MYTLKRSGFWLAMIFMICLTLSCAAVSAAEGPELPGSGTAADPWVIRSEQDFLTAYDYFKQPGLGGSADHFRLETDIALTQTLSQTKGDGAVLKGTFDGNGHTLSNVRASVREKYFNDNYDEIWGNFASALFTENQGTIENLTVELGKQLATNKKPVGYSASCCCGLAESNRGRIQNCRVTGSLTADLKTKSGSLIANFNDVGASIENCTVSGSLTAFNGTLGGIAATNCGTVANCTANVSLTANSDTLWSSDQSVTIGGIVGTNGPGVGDGEFEGEALVTGCTANITATAAVTGQPPAGEKSKYLICLGGIAGKNNGRLSGCAASGPITSSREATIGGITGHNYVSNVINTDSYSTGTITNCTAKGTLISPDLNSLLGGIAAKNEGEINGCTDLTNLAQEPSAGGEDDREITVSLNGTPITFDQPPIMENNRTLVPMRAIFEAMGAQVVWDEPTQTVTAIGQDLVVSLRLGEATMYRNGAAIALDVPAKSLNGRTLVPVRAISEAFGAKVEWNDPRRQVVITTPAAVSNSGSPSSPGSGSSSSNQSQGPDGLPNCIICNNTGSRQCTLCHGSGTITTGDFTAGGGVQDSDLGFTDGGIYETTCTLCHGAGTLPCVCGR